MADGVLDQITKRETEKPVTAAVTWVIDKTMSMHEEIPAIRDALNEFANMFEKRRVRLHLGMISYRDLTQGEDIDVHQFDGKEFTRSADAFRAQVETLNAEGGGPEPESTYDALVKACGMDWPQGCEKIIVLVTDATSHTSTTTKDAAHAAMEAAGLSQFYALTHTTEPRIRDCYVDFTKIGKGGTMFDMGNRDRTSLLKTIRNIGLTASERTGGGGTDTKTE
jgi:hypothetical protein